MKNSLRFPSWVFYAASRYVSARRRDKSSPSAFLSVLGIAVGVMALIVVLSVMNGFQLGFIESILELSSYHVRIENVPADKMDGSFVQDLRSSPGLVSVIPFVELQGIVRGSRRGQQACVIRGIPANAADLDPGFAEKLDFEAGSFDLSDPRSALVGAELARILGLSVGDEFTALALSGTSFEAISPENGSFRVAGIFRSGFYDYDLGWAFIGLDAATALHGLNAPFVYGIKLSNRWNDAAAVANLDRLTAGSGMRVVSWRHFNRAFFGALRTEKIMMFLLVGLIFVIVALNIFQAQRRMALERREEIGLLRAVGASVFSVRLVFACDGLIIGLAGATSGLVAGLLLAGNIQAFFSVLEFVANAVIGVINLAASIFSGGNADGAESFSIFSPAVFYIREIPSRTIPLEVVVIYCFGFLSSTLAAWTASGKAALERPAEVLRYE